MTEERLQKFISGCGVTSRRKAEELILSGAVTVNGVVADRLGIKIDTDKDVVSVEGRTISYATKRTYIKLYKPTGYVTTVKDQFGRKCVMDLIDIDIRVYPIGRLDYDTEGLLLLTDDGELANRLMHPKFNVFKTYMADVDKAIDDECIERLRSGVMIEGRKTSEARVRLTNRKRETSSVEISIREGRNRQVRKMFEAVGCTVLKLKRISYGKITLSSLKPGQWCHLTDSEVCYLKTLGIN